MTPAYDKARGWSEPVCYDLTVMFVKGDERGKVVRVTSPSPQRRVDDAIHELEDRVGVKVAAIDCHPAAPNVLHREPYPGETGP